MRVCRGGWKEGTSALYRWEGGMGGVEKKWDETECRVMEKREKREEERDRER